MAPSARSGRALLRERNGKRSTALLFVACALTAASACNFGGSGDNKTKESPTPSASASKTSKPADPSETAKKEAISTYKAYWQEMEKLYDDSSGKDADLKKYAAALALIRAEADAKRAHDEDLIHTGQVAVGNSTVTKLDIDRKVPNATISSCLDISRWKVVDTGTKKPVSLPSNRLTKYVIVSTVERWPEGWRVIEDEPQDKPC